MKATQTNTEESEHDTEWEGLRPAKIKKEEHIPKTGLLKYDADQKTVLYKWCHKLVPITDAKTTNLFHHLCNNHVKQYGESYIPTLDLTIVEKYFMFYILYIDI